MPEIYDSQLRLSLIADPGDTEQVLTDVAGLVDKLATELTDLGGMANPFAKFTDSIDSMSESLQTMTENLSTFSESVNKIATINTNPFEKWATSLGTANTDAGDLSKNASDIAKIVANPFEKWAMSLGTANTDSGDLSKNADTIAKISADPFAKWTESLSTATGDIITLLQDTDAIYKMTSDPYASWVTGASEIKTDMADALKSMESMETIKLPAGGSGQSLSDAQLNEIFGGVDQETAGMLPSGKSGKSSTTSSSSAMSEFSKSMTEAAKQIGEIPNKLLTGAMNGMMLGMGVNSIANADNNFASISQIANMNNLNGSTAGINRAAQIQAMLGSQGLSGSAAPQFLSQLESTVKSMLMPGPGMTMSAEGLQLEQMGITQKDLTLSPFELLNTVGSQYRKLTSEGQGSQAAALAGLTGTSQVTGLMSNWNSINSQMSSLNLNMNPSQLKSAVSQDVTLQGSIQKLGLSFDDLSLKLTPVVTKLVNGFTDLANALQGKNLVGNIKNFETNTDGIGPLLTLFGLSSGINAGKSVIGAGKAVAGGLGALGRVAGTEAALAPEEGAMASTGVGAIPAAALAVGGAVFAYFEPQILSAFNKLASNVGKDFKPFETAVGNFGHALWSNTKTDWNNFETNLGSFAHGLWTGTKTDWQSFETNLGTFGKNLWSNTHKDFDSFTAGLGMMGSNLWSNVQKDFDSFTTSLTSWASSLEQAGSAALNGIKMAAQGVLVGVDQVINQDVPFGNKLVSNNTLAQNEFSLQMMQAGMKPGIQVVDHSGKIQVEITGKGITASEKETALSVADALISRLKLSSNFDLSY